MFGRIFSRVADPVNLVATALICLAVVAMVRRNTFGIQKLTG